MSKPPIDRRPRAAAHKGARKTRPTLLLLLALLAGPVGMITSLSLSDEGAFNLNFASLLSPSKTGQSAVSDKVARSAIWSEPSLQVLTGKDRAAMIAQVMAQKEAAAHAEAVRKAKTTEKLAAADQAKKAAQETAVAEAETLAAENQARQQLERLKTAAMSALRQVLTERVALIGQADVQSVAANVPAASNEAPQAVAQADLPENDGAAAASDEKLVVASIAPEMMIPVPTKRPAAPKPQASQTAQTARTARAPQAMAYAPANRPEDDDNGVFSGLSKIFNGGTSALPGRGSGIAVYDISEATVHMPDGTELEAHSGIGKMMDDPRHFKKKNRGPTPPNIYKLRMRESLFHGVEAIRMLPRDRAAMYGRDGMLTHTNLLRGRIGSHGCVAFKDYAKFLNAFKAGKVHTLIVVPRMNELPTYMASL
ncbi:DUF2778 domain-containing protein [Roseibium limicola]|nr:DUF2778 domain-containing protein [Roseibium limicola]